MVCFSLDLVCSDNSAAQCVYRRDVVQFDFQSVDEMLPNSKVGTLAPYCVYVVFFTLVLMLIYSSTRASMLLRLLLLVQN